MKNIFLSSLAAMIMVSTCQAQGNQTFINVSFGPAGNPSCTFTDATSIMNGFTSTVSIGSQVGRSFSGPPNVSPITIVKGLDRCSIPLLTNLFRGTVIPEVTITVSNVIEPAGTPPLLKLVLSEAFVTSLSDSDSTSSVPAERVTLVFEKMIISAGGANLTCSISTNFCA